MLAVRTVHVDVVGGEARHVAVEVDPSLQELFPGRTAVAQIVRNIIKEPMKENKYLSYNS